METTNYIIRGDEEKITGGSNQLVQKALATVWTA